METPDSNSKMSVLTLTGDDLVDLLSGKHVEIPANDKKSIPAFLISLDQTNVESHTIDEKGFRAGVTAISMKDKKAERFDNLSEKDRADRVVKAMFGDDPKADFDETPIGKKLKEMMDEIDQAISKREATGPDFTPEHVAEAVARDAKDDGGEKTPDSIVRCHDHLHALLEDRFAVMNKIEDEMKRLRRFHKKMHRRTQAAESNEIASANRLIKSIEAQGALKERLRLLKGSTVGRMALSRHGIS